MKKKLLKTEHSLVQHIHLRPIRTSSIFTMRFVSMVFLTVISFLLLTIPLVHAIPAPCSVEQTELEMKALYASFVSLTSSDASLAAGFIRGGFHDCATANMDKPKSGCNGSLRNEGDARPNARLVTMIGVVTSKRNEIAPCVSYADAFMLAFAAGTKTTTGLSIAPLVANPASPREDSEDDETDVDSEGRLQLPNPGSRDFSQLLEFYTDRKMTLNDLISSNAIGHSVGSVRSRDVDALFPLNNFTAIPNRGGPFYSAHLLWRFDTSSERDLSGFFTLPSDQTLVSDQRGYNVFQSYSRYNILGPKSAGRESDQKVRLSWTGAQSRVVMYDYQQFAVRMSQLSGDIMTGDKSFSIPSSASELKRERAGWDGKNDLPFTGTGLDKDLNPALSDIAEEDKSWVKVGTNFFKTFQTL